MAVEAPTVTWENTSGLRLALPYGASPKVEFWVSVAYVESGLSARTEVLGPFTAVGEGFWSFPELKVEQGLSEGVLTKVDVIVESTLADGTVLGHQAPDSMWFLLENGQVTRLNLEEALLRAAPQSGVPKEGVFLGEAREGVGMKVLMSEVEELEVLIEDPTGRGVSR